MSDKTLEAHPDAPRDQFDVFVRDLHRQFHDAVHHTWECRPISRESYTNAMRQADAERAL